MSFPLFSLGAILAMISGVGVSSSGVIYLGIGLFNGILLLVATIEQQDFLVWFVLFEASVIAGVSALTVEGRSFRRLFALSLMLMATFAGGCGVYAGVFSVRSGIDSVTSS